MELKSLQSWHTRCVQRVSKNRWAVVWRTYLHFRKDTSHPVVTHIEFLTGVCWPCMAVSWMFPAMLPLISSKASTAWAAEMPWVNLHCHYLSKSWKAVPMCWSTVLSVSETRKRGGTAHTVNPRGNERGRSWGGWGLGDLWSISSRGFERSSSDVRRFIQRGLYNFFFLRWV